MKKQIENSKNKIEGYENKVAGYELQVISFSGFSLVEVLIAIVVVSVAAVSFATLMTASLQGITKLDGYMVANFISINEIENVRQLRDSSYMYYLQDPVAHASYKYPLDSISSGARPDVTLNGITYAISRDVVCLQANAGHCLKLQIKVSVKKSGQEVAGGTDYLYDYLPEVETF